MAELLPEISLEEITLKPERDVARALIEQLPENVIVIHSYPWLQSYRNITGEIPLTEGEADFVVLWPEMGILVIEVKGGEITYDADRQKYFRVLEERKKLIQDPVKQAQKSMHYIVGQIRYKIYKDRKSLPFPYGYAVIFPDCVYSGSVPHNADQSMIFSAKDLDNISEKVAHVLRRWQRKSYVIEQEELAKIKRAIYPEFNLIPALSRTIEEQEEKLVRLNEEQIQLLNFLGDHKRAAIRGVTGSGKTMLARYQAEKLAEDGKKVLLICFNKKLAAWLQQIIYSNRSDLDTLIDVYHFHGLCQKLCKEANIDFSPSSKNSDISTFYNDSTFYNEEAPKLLQQALERKSDQRYDAVIVDEGQDFHQSWWQPLELINTDRENGFLYVFYDRAQNLFTDRVDTVVSIPNIGEPFNLPRNYRNTKNVAKILSEILNIEITTHPEALEGIATEFFIRKEKHEQSEELDKIVKKLISQEKMSNSQIAILSPYKVSHLIQNKNNKVGGQTVTHDIEEWIDGKGILFSSIRSFKGLEADIVILVDVVEPGSEKNFSKTDFYVACSRAKHVLKIIYSEDTELLKKIRTAVNNE